MATRKIRVIITKVGLDGHDRGAKVITSLLREAGIEVIYLGMFQTAENIVSAAVQEDADVIGLSILSGEHLSYTAKVMELMKQHKLIDVLLLVGGVVPGEDVATLKEMGVHEVFPAGTLTKPIVDYIGNNVREK